MRPKLLLLDEPHPKAMAIMESMCELTTTPAAADIIYTQLTPVYVARWETAIVFSPCTGVDHIKAPNIIHLDEEWKRTEGRNITSTAEHTWSLILQLAKLNKMQLSGKTIGIIGYGRIGQQVAKYAQAFEMYVRLYDIKETLYSFEQIIKESDIITLHVPLNEETKGMIGKEQFDMMKPGALLVNTSRAEIVSKNDLIETLKIWKIGGYADDFAYYHSDEFISFASAEKFITTPHIAGNCKEAREATDIYIANKIVEYVRRSENP